jgi:uncharacterized protein (TIGR02145 family)
MKYIIYLYAILLFVTFQIYSQNSVPEVTNVTFNQRTDGSFIVDVYYDLNDAEGDTMLLTMQVSEDSGATWLFNCDSASGDVGEGILTGTGKSIVWDFGAEHPQTFGDAFRIRIIADDQVLTMGTVSDIDGNVYQTVKIGLQWWMAENLKVTRYSNGDNIQHITNPYTWTGLSTGAYCAYNNNNNGNIATYGLLYNWYTVADNRDIGPAGWHVPADNEWKELEMYLGMSQAQANASGMRGTDEGAKMKEAGTAHWYSPNIGATNSSGFTALPGGHRYDVGAFRNKGSYGYWWSSSWQPWSRVLDSTELGVWRYKYDKRYGFSVRLVRD